MYWIGHILPGLLIFLCFPSYSSLYVADLKVIFSKKPLLRFLQSLHALRCFALLTSEAFPLYHLFMIIPFYSFICLQYLAQCLLQIGAYHPLEEQKNKWKYKVFFSHWVNIYFSSVYNIMLPYMLNIYSCMFSVCRKVYRKRIEGSIGRNRRWRMGSSQM